MLDHDLENLQYGGRRVVSSDYNPTTDAAALWLCCSDDGVASSGKCSSLVSRVGGHVFDNAFSPNRLTCNTALISGHQVLEQPNTAQGGGRQLFYNGATLPGQLNGAVSHTAAFYVRRDNADVLPQQLMSLECSAGAAVGGLLAWGNPTAVVTSGIRHSRTGASGAGTTAYTYTFTRTTGTWKLEAWTYDASTGTMTVYIDGALVATLPGTIRNPNLLDIIILGNQSSSAQGLVYYGLWFATKTLLSATQHAQLDSWVATNLWS